LVSERPEHDVFLEVMQIVLGDEVSQIPLAVDSRLRCLARVVRDSFRGDLLEIKPGWINQGDYFELMQKVGFIEGEPNQKGYYRLSSKAESFYKVYYPL